VLIDVHGHIGRSPDTAEELTLLGAYLDAARIGRLLISSHAATRTAGDVEEVPANLAALTAQRADPRLVPLYRVRLGRFDAHVSAFAGALSLERFAGALFAPALDDYPCDDPRLEAYFAVLAQLRRPAFMLVQGSGQARPARAHALARRTPHVPLVMICAARGPHWAEATDALERTAQQGGADLLLATSHASIAEVRHTVERAGADRLLLGSDAVAGGRVHIARQVTWLDDLRSAISEDDYEAITRANAERLLSQAGAAASQLR
jgi:predicted TIM-barrel fold metal-dependent hydrolase